MAMGMFSSIFTCTVHRNRLARNRQHCLLGKNAMSSSPTNCSALRNPWTSLFGLHGHCGVKTALAD